MQDTGKAAGKARGKSEARTLKAELKATCPTVQRSAFSVLTSDFLLWLTTSCEGGVVRARTVRTRLARGRAPRRQCASRLRRVTAVAARRPKKAGQLLTAVL